MLGCRLDSLGSGQGPVSGISEHEMNFQDAQTGEEIS